MHTIEDLLLPWERLLWHQRARTLRECHYLLSDFRLLRLSRHEVAELVLADIGEIHRTESAFDRIIGTSTIVVRARHGGRALVLERVARGAQLAGLLEWIAGDPESAHDPAAVQAALAWTPAAPGTSLREPLVGLAAVFSLVGCLAIALHGTEVPVTYSPTEAIYPGGSKREQQAIRAFMEAEVLPWARTALGPVVGGADRVTCATCHGEHAIRRDWRMPSVARLPEPVLAIRGWERYSHGMDPQTRNAVYGYLAESDKQATAAYMREVVMPGMARLLGRPAYDFTKSYEYNRTHHAFGCYHCHTFD